VPLDRGSACVQPRAVVQVVILEKGALPDEDVDIGLQPAAQRLCVDLLPSRRRSGDRCPHREIDVLSSGMWEPGEEGQCHHPGVLQRGNAHRLNSSKSTCTTSGCALNGSAADNISSASRGVRPVATIADWVSRSMVMSSC
jgi:hypothetical protein